MQRRRLTSACRVAVLAALAGSIGCSLPASYGYPGQAQRALIAFFDRLSRGQYASAAELYGGDYIQLQIFGPDLQAGNHAGLWQSACEKSGLQCLPTRSVKYLGSDGPIYTFMVEFLKPDGNAFALAPCCGEPGFVHPPMADFVYRVLRTSHGEYLVMDLPVYVP